MSTRWVNVVGGLLITVGLALFAVTASVVWLLCFLAGVGLILENWIKGKNGRG